MIRAVTLGVPLAPISINETEQKLLLFTQTAEQVFKNNHVFCRTQRMSLTPVREDAFADLQKLPARIASIARLAEKSGLRWFCLPVDLLACQNPEALLQTVLEIMMREPRAFINLMVGNEHQISVEGATHAAQFILNVAKKSNNGFDNFRVGASAACPANAPFFPFSRHEGNDLGFSLALETADMALVLSEEVKAKRLSLQAFRDSLIASLVKQLSTAAQLAQEIAEKTKIAYKGLDAALAPFPDGKTSIGLLLDNLGAPIGSAGTLFVTSLLTDAIRQAIKESGVIATGFNGVMYSVLEDDYLARANNQRKLSIQALNAYSTLCACGLDMLPIAGTSFPEDIAATILDTAALAINLKKPLGVRLLPIPGKALNELTAFNLDFLCDSRIMELEAGSANLSLENMPWQYLAPRL